MYKLKKATADNFKGFDSIELSFSEDIMYLCGPNGSGKSSGGLDIIWATLQGVGSKAPSKDTNPLIAERYQIIGDAGKSAKTSITLHDVQKGYDIKVTRKILKDGSELHFDTDADITLDQRFLNEIFNLYLVSPKKFIELTPKAQSIALGIDLSRYDEKIKELKNEFTLINRQIKDLGTPVEVEVINPVDVTALVTEKAKRTAFNTEQINRQATIDANMLKWTAIVAEQEKCIIDQQDYHHLQSVIEQMTVGNIKSAEVKTYISSINLYLANTIANLDDKLDEVSPRIAKGSQYISSLPKPEELLDIAELDEQIANASSINVLASQYDAYVKAVEKRESLVTALEDNKTEQKKVEDARTAKIASFALPFEELTINEDGELLLQNRYLKSEYWSAGELIRTVPMLIIASMKATGREIKFPYCYISDWNLLDSTNQKEIIDFFKANKIQCVLEVVSEERTGTKNSIFLKDNHIITE